MIVCICNQVSEKAIQEHATRGLGFDDIQLELDVATQCGKCECLARDIVRQCDKRGACGKSNTCANKAAIALTQTVMTPILVSG